MRKIVMIAFVLFVAVTAFSYTFVLSEAHEGFKGEPVATFDSYAKET